MQDGTDRRAPGATRIPFEALVEVGGALGPAFEAEALDLSEDGMQMRTAYLPEIGQPLTCRFDVGPAASVLASGEVMWKREEGRVGEFGVRFTDVDPESAAILKDIVLGKESDVPVAPAANAASEDGSPALLGSRVRLHIDGLGSPMRARVKDVRDGEVTVGSDLGFLQVGKDLDVEDANTGSKRPARIGNVDVEVDSESRVPQLVVTLQMAGVTSNASTNRGESMSMHENDDARAHGTDDVDGTSAPRSTMAPRAASARANVDASESDAESVEAESDKLRSSFAKKAASIGPAVAKFAERAKNTVILLAKKRRSKEDASFRRTTAPAPGGGLHTAGRKVVRGEAGEDDSETRRFQVDKRKLAIGGAVGLAVILAAVAMRKPEPKPVATDAATASAAPADPNAPGAPNASMPAAPTLPAAPVAPGAVAPNGALANGATQPMNPSMQGPIAQNPGAVSPLPAAAEPMMEEADAPVAKPRRVHVKPFGNATVAHGNVLRLKMSDTIEKLQGAAQPTGFTVVVPNRRSLEAAAPLASRDSRIASIKVSNDSSGAELAVTFKDGVPKYQVRAKGDVLEIALAPMSASDAPSVADNGKHHARGSHASAKSSKKSHKKSH